MEKNRSLGFTHTATGLSVLGCLLLTGCASMPRTNIYNDPLTSAEHVTLANAYTVSDRKDLADKQYRAALKKNKKNLAAIMALGNAAYEKKDWDEARKHYRRVLKIKPGDAGAINNLAMVDIAEGKPLDEALTQVENALPTAATLRPYLLDTLANIAIIQGRMDDAKLVLDLARKEAPTNDPDFIKRLDESTLKLAQSTPDQRQ